MSIIKGVTLGSMLLLGLAAWAQEFPRVEVGADYSYVRYAPSASYTKGHSLNGGGGSATYNFTSYLGIKMDLQGFNSNTTGFNIAPNSTFPNGLNGSVSGNLFTYLLVLKSRFGCTDSSRSANCFLVEHTQTCMATHSKHFANP